jgi:hypothetical protein
MHNSGYNYDAAYYLLDITHYENPKLSFGIPTINDPTSIIWTNH